MPLNPLGHSPAAGTTLLFRFLLAGLATLAVAVEGQLGDARLAALGATYVVAASLSWWLASRGTWPWVSTAMALADAGVVAGLLWLVPPTTLPLWSLFLFPLATAAAIGPLPAATVAALGSISALAIAWARTGTFGVDTAWPAALLAAAALVLVRLASRWRAEQQERRAWQEVAAAARGLAGRDGEPQDVGTRVAERARRLVHAAGATVWWCDAGGRRLADGPRAGAWPEHLHPPAELPVGAARELERGPAALATLETAAGVQTGEVVALRHAGRWLGLLALTWATTHPDRAAQRARLRLFAPWAADALAQAQARAAAHERLRREHVLRQAATALAATLEPPVVYEAALHAARTSLRASTAVVVPSTGQRLAGDATRAPAALPLGAAAGDSPERTDGSAAPFTLALADDLVLLIERSTPPLDAEERAWLAELAAAVRQALDRCAAHAALKRDALCLGGALEELPAPAGLWDGEGRLLVANAAYRALGGVASAAPPRPDAREEELALSEPARTFMATTLPIAEGQYVLRYLREVTREREALRAKDQLIALVGHELRTPLTSIYGYSQMMARQLGVVQQQVGQLNALIRDFMDAARLESGDLPLARERVQVAELVHATAERFQGAHEGHRLHLELAEDLPSVEGDPIRLGQVLDNLLSNAAKYSPAGSEIVLAVRLEGGEVLLAVQDEGAGIPPEHLPHIFDRFYRVPGESTERVEGYGLGLSIVRDLVVGHGGRIWAESAGEGKGSTFCVALPAAPHATTPAAEVAGAAGG